MKKSILKKQTVGKLKSDYKIVNRLYIIVAVVIIASLAYSAYHVQGNSAESFNFLPFALMPIFIILGLKTISIKRAIYESMGEES